MGASGIHTVGENAWDTYCGGKAPGIHSVGEKRLGNSGTDPGQSAATPTGENRPGTLDRFQDRDQENQNIGV